MIKKALLKYHNSRISFIHCQRLENPILFFFLLLNASLKNSVFDPDKIITFDMLYPNTAYLDLWTESGVNLCRQLVS